MDALRLRTAAGDAIDVQAHAAAWMWSVGRIGEWTGKGC